MKITQQQQSESSKNQVQSYSFKMENPFRSEQKGGGGKDLLFLTFPECFSIPIIFSDLNSNYSNLLDMRNLQEQVKKAFCYQKLF